jgi:L-fuculose-phosphate aldolase
MEHADTLRHDIVTCCQRLYQRGLLASTEGNVSALAGPDRLWITPAGSHKGFLKIEDLLLIDSRGTVHFGSGRPSSETPMHLALYRCRPDIRAVVHAHPPIATALTVAKCPLETRLLPETVVLLREVPTLPYTMPTTPEFAQKVGEGMQRVNAALLENHGGVTLGTSLQMAFNLMETLERAAQILYLAKTLGHVQPLSVTAVAALQALR